MSVVKELFASLFLWMALLGAFIVAGGAAHAIVWAVTTGWEYVS